MKERITNIRELCYGVRVTIDTGETLCLRNKDCKHMALQEGDTVSLEEWKHDILLNQYPDALNRAVRLLAVRARSIAEIEKRLSDACFMADTVDMVITKLTSNGLLSDEAFARQWARDRSARQMGKARILYELRQKGVESALAEQVVGELEPEQQADAAEQLARKLLRRHQNAAAADAYRKTIQAMQRRGYSYSEAKQALTKALEGTDL